MKVSILGTEYEIKRTSEEEYPKLKKLEANGLAELYSKQLIINDDVDDGSESCFEKIELFKNKVTRHEIIHAFLYESGAINYCNDEKLVDLLAVQIPKMIKVFKETECIE
ncbi:MAG: hypothetical protein ACERKZ_05720 [Lachnotalea sp.]